MLLEINKELVLSTAHISYFTSLSLAEGHATDNDSEVPYGWRIWVDAEVDPVHHEELVDLLALAKLNECKWLVLDQDAEIVPELKQYEW